MNVYKQESKVSKRSRSLSQQFKTTTFLLRVGYRKDLIQKRKVARSKREAISERSVSSSSWVQCTCSENFDFT